MSDSEICNENSCEFNFRLIYEAIINEDEGYAITHLLKLSSDSWIDSEGQTFLHYSVKYKNVSVVEFLIENGWDVNHSDINGVTPLFLAVEMRNLKITEVLLKNNAEIFIRNNSGTSLLQCAADAREDRFEWDGLEVYDFDILEVLFKKINKDYLKDKDRIGRLLLNEHLKVKNYSLIFCNKDLTNYILENDNDAVDCRLEPYINTPLHYAVIFGKVDNAEILINRGANVNVLDIFDRSPLHYYTDKFQNLDINSKVLKLLLQRCVNVKHSEIQKLFIYGNRKTVKTVLQSQIEIPTFFNKNRTILHLLALNNDAEAIEVLDELLIEFDLNARDQSGATALYCTAWCRHLKQMEFLLEHGADVNLNLNNGRSSLQAAMMMRTEYSDNDLESLNCFSRCKKTNMIDVVRLLLQYGANVRDITNSCGILIPQSKIASEMAISCLVLREAVGELLPGAKKFKQIFKSSNFYACSIFQQRYKQLELMKMTEVYDKVTLFQLLTEKQDKLLIYARNPELMLAFKATMKNMSDLDLYFSDTLNWRVNKAIEQIELEQKATLIIEDLSGVCSDSFNHIYRQIISYFNNRDLRNVCRI